MGEREDYADRDLPPPGRWTPVVRAGLRVASALVLLGLAVLTAGIFLLLTWIGA